MAIARLLDSELPVTVILTMRDDFYSRFSQMAQPLLSWLERGLSNVPKLHLHELNAIVEEPASSVGIRFEAGLTDAIVRDAHQGAGLVGGITSDTPSTILPLLEFTLDQLWVKREDATLTHAAYRAIGGVTGALTQWADQVYYSLGPTLRPLCRRIFTDLVYLGDEHEGRPDSRRRRPIAELARAADDDARVWLVIRQLANARIVVTGQGFGRTSLETVEIIHEALIREWGELQSWLRQDRRFLGWRQEFETRRQLWLESDVSDATRRDDDRLLRGRDLAEAMAWLAERQADLTDLGREYIQVSHQLQEREEQNWKELYERAERHRKEALARQLGAQAELVRGYRPAHLLTSMLLAIESLRRQPSIEAEQPIRHGIELAAVPERRLKVKSSVTELAFSGDGRYIAAVELASDVLRMCDVAGGLTYDVRHQDRISAMAFRPGALQIATASYGLVRVLDIASWTEWLRIPFSDDAEAVAFSADGRLLLMGVGDGTARVWDVNERVEVARIQHAGLVTLAFSSDRRYLLATQPDGSTVEWGTDRPDLERANSYYTAVGTVALSPTGERVATMSHDGLVRVWDVVSGYRDELVHFSHRSARLLVFRADGRYLATASTSPSGWDQPAPQDVIVWDVVNGREVAHLPHPDMVPSIAFSPDGASVVTACHDGIARVWTVPDGRLVMQAVHEGIVHSVAFCPTRDIIATASADQTARLWTVPGGKEVARATHDGSALVVDFSPDGQHFATGSWEPAVRTWKVPPPVANARVVHHGEVSAFAFDTDGNLVSNGPLTTDLKLKRDQRGRTPEWYVDAFSVGVHAAAFVADQDFTVFLDNEQWQDSASVEFPFSRREQSLPPPNVLWARSKSTRTIRQWGLFEAAEPASGASEADSSVGTLAIRFREPYRGGSDVALSPDKRYVASTARLGTSEAGTFEERNGTLHIWWTARSDTVALLSRKASINYVIFSPDGKYLVVAPENGPVELWDIAVRKVTKRFRAGRPALMLAFSPDARRLAITAGERVAEDEIRAHALTVVDVETEQTLMAASVEGPVFSACFTPDGEHLATATKDCIVRVWEVMGGREVSRIPLEHPCDWVAFSSDARYLAAVGDEVVRVMIWRAEDLIDRACRRLTRNLTRLDWKQYLGDEPYRATCRLTT